VAWPRNAKIAFIGSHGIRKTTAALAFAHVIQRAGRSVEFAREVVRDNPLGINEAASCEAQLWVLASQVRRELELAPKAECLVTDRGVMDNFAYYLRACGGEDPYAVEPLVRAWSRTYDLVVRLTPDVRIRADGVRSTDDRFRDEVEALLDARLPRLVPRDRLIEQRASEVTEMFDWWPLAEQLAARLGEQLLAAGVKRPTGRVRGGRRGRAAATGGATSGEPAAGRAVAEQLGLDLDRGSGS
jgi:nicotinamide riboside kinase